MENKYKVSVIVPVFNVDKYLKRCIESLLNQLMIKDIEIILIDDGSSDRSGDICDRYALEYSNVSSFHKKNGGLSSARNYGILHSRSEWITFVDADDYVSNSYVSDLYGMIKDFNSDMAITRLVRRNESAEIRDKRREFETFVVDKKQAIYEVYVGDRVGWSACGKLFRKDILLKYPFPDGYYEDSASMYKFIDSCERVAIGDYRNNYFYICRKGSITSSVYSNKHKRIFEVCDEISEFIKLKYPTLNYISILMYVNATQQILNRLELSKKDYKVVYRKNCKLFRKELFYVLGNKKIPWKTKIYVVFLCTNPSLYRIFHLIICKINKR